MALHLPAKSISLFIKKGFARINFHRCLDVFRVADIKLSDLGSCVNIGEECVVLHRLKTLNFPGHFFQQNMIFCQITAVGKEKDDIIGERIDNCAFCDIIEPLAQISNKRVFPCLFRQFLY